MNDWTSNKKTLILIGVLILILLIIVAVNLIKERPKFPGDALSPLFKSRIGETSDKEISSNPDLLNKVTQDDKTIYTFKPNPNLVGNQVITENGRAVFEKGTIVEAESKLHLFSDYINKYGQPEAEYSGSKTYGKFEKTYVWASLGFALKVNPDTQEVDQIQKFTPTTVAEYLKKWGTDITSFVETKEEF